MDDFDRPPPSEETESGSTIYEHLTSLTHSSMPVCKAYFWRQDMQWPWFVWKQSVDQRCCGGLNLGCQIMGLTTSKILPSHADSQKDYSQRPLSRNILLNKQKVCSQKRYFSYRDNKCHPSSCLPCPSDKGINHTRIYQYFLISFPNPCPGLHTMSPKFSSSETISLWHKKPKATSYCILTE